MLEMVVALLNIPIESVPALPGCGLGLSGPVLNGELPSRQHGLFNHITLIMPKLLSTTLQAGGFIYQKISSVWPEQVMC